MADQAPQCAWLTLAGLCPQWLFAIFFPGRQTAAFLARQQDREAAILR
jgi:hypothetical protein